MGIERGIEGADPVRGEQIGFEEERRARQTGVLGIGTLACPACDAPVAPGPDALSPSDALGCPVCSHGGHVRDFLSMAPPSRPARVLVRLVVPARA